jgi:hypothetical protein
MAATAALVQQLIAIATAAVEAVEHTTLLDHSTQVLAAAAVAAMAA